MKIRIPKKFNVLDNIVTVKIEKDLMSRTNQYAQLSYADHWIKIDASLSAQEKCSSFMHELIEYCLCILGCEITRFGEEHQYLVTHKEVDTFSKMIRQALESAEY